MTIPAAGKADLVAVSQFGEVWLIECKLKTNQESRRAVAGQVLAYAGGLWKLGCQDFEKRFNAVAPNSLMDLLTGNAVGEFDEEEFWHGLKETLDAGRFGLIIAIDQVTDELRNIVEFVNETAKSLFTFAVLELGYIVSIHP